MTSGDPTSDNTHTGYSSVLIAASSPWTFTQQYPLSTSEFCEAAKKRRISLHEEQLPGLWRVGALAPFVEVRNKPVHPKVSLESYEPQFGVSWNLEQLKHAVEAGRLVDPVDLGFRPQLRFHMPVTETSKRIWWNGLLYSRWQLLGIYELLQRLLSHGKWKRPLSDDRLATWRSRNLTTWETQVAEDARRLATLLVALESRYLPTLEQRKLHLINLATYEEWEAFIQHFDPAAILTKLNREPDDLLRLANSLLLRAKQTDPLGDDWSELLRRAPKQMWDNLSGEALIALDYRIAAELLLLCYEDLAKRGTVPPLTQRNDMFYFERERISYRHRSLDGNLSKLGLSPHPGVVLVVEGDTEEVIVPLVRDYLRIPNQAEVIQSIVMRGSGRDLTKLAAFVAAPLLEKKMPQRSQGDVWIIVKPPTRLMIVVDPDAPHYDSSEHVENTRQKIIDEIILVIRAQGMEPNRDDIDSLVSIKTWSEPCFEFAHFTDAELAEALEVHSDCGGLDKARLVTILKNLRDSGNDVKSIWHGKNWHPFPSKSTLARQMWPVLQRKIDTATSDTSVEMPPIAKAILDAFWEAARRPPGNFVLRGSELG